MGRASAVAAADPPGKPLLCDILTGLKTYFGKMAVAPVHYGTAPKWRISAMQTLLEENPNSALYNLLNLVALERGCGTEPLQGTFQLC